MPRIARFILASRHVVAFGPRHHDEVVDSLVAEELQRPAADVGRAAADFLQTQARATGAELQRAAKAGGAKQLAGAR